MARRTRKHEAKRLKGEVLIAEILDWALRDGPPTRDAPWSERRNWNNLSSTCRRLAPFWAERNADEATIATAAEYRAERFGSTCAGGAPCPEREPGVTRTTIDGELSTLRRLIDGFGSGLGWAETDLGELRKARAKRRKPLSRGEIVRLLWAARGSIYTPLRPGARRIPGGGTAEGLRPSCFAGKQEFRPGRRKLSRAHLFRFILISFYSGSTADCVARLRWRGDPDGEDSFVDAQNGFLYRLGPDAAPGKQSGMPVPLTPRLLAFLRRWERLDASAGHTHVLHSLQSREARNTPGTGFDGVRADAGLPEAQMRQLPLATGATLMRRGVGMRSAAIYMGLSEDTFAQRFKHFRKDAHAAAKGAIERRATTVRDMPKASADAWRDRARAADANDPVVRSRRARGIAGAARSPKAAGPPD